jgi:hypothetical protein
MFIVGDRVRVNGNIGSIIDFDCTSFPYNVQFEDGETGGYKAEQLSLEADALDSWYDDDIVSNEGEVISACEDAGAQMRSKMEARRAKIEAQLDSVGAEEMQVSMEYSLGTHGLEEAVHELPQLAQKTREDQEDCTMEFPSCLQDGLIAAVQGRSMRQSAVAELAKLSSLEQHQLNMDKKRSTQDLEVLTLSVSAMHGTLDNISIDGSIQEPCADSAPEPVASWPSLKDCLAEAVHRRSMRESNAAELARLTSLEQHLLNMEAKGDLEYSAEVVPSEAPFARSCTKPKDGSIDIPCTEIECSVNIELSQESFAPERTPEERHNDAAPCPAWTASLQECLAAAVLSMHQSLDPDMVELSPPEQDLLNSQTNRYMEEPEGVAAAKMHLLDVKERVQKQLQQELDRADELEKKAKAIKEENAKKQERLLMNWETNLSTVESLIEEAMMKDGRIKPCFDEAPESLSRNLARVLCKSSCEVSDLSECGEDVVRRQLDHHQVLTLDSLPSVAGSCYAGTFAMTEGSSSFASSHDDSILDMYERFSESSTFTKSGTFGTSSVASRRAAAVAKVVASFCSHAGLVYDNTNLASEQLEAELSLLSNQLY